MWWFLTILNPTMIQNKFGEMIFSERDLCNLLMQGHDEKIMDQMIVENSIDFSQWPDTLIARPNVVIEPLRDCSVSDFHKQQQSHWHMPNEYKNFDIAEYVLGLCKTEAELQRCGQELMLYQERDLFDLLRYLKYLVDVMKEHDMVWGVGRGSSVASYVLYLLQVHRIDSIYYNLDIHEFLR